MTELNGRLTNNEKERNLEAALAQIEKNFGKGTIMRLGNEENLGGEVSVIPTGSVSLDIALRIAF